MQTSKDLSKNNLKVESKRKYPRRDFTANIGVLISGHYIVCSAREIGEGGLSFICDFTIEENKDVVVSFKVPGSDFFSVRATIKSVRKEGAALRVGILFKSISFEMKRQIRAFVAG